MTTFPTVQPGTRFDALPAAAQQQPDLFARVRDLDQGRGATYFRRTEADAVQIGSPLEPWAPPIISGALWLALRNWVGGEMPKTIFDQLLQLPIASQPASTEGSAHLEAGAKLLEQSATALDAARRAQEAAAARLEATASAARDAATAAQAAAEAASKQQPPQVRVEAPPAPNVSVPIELDHLGERFAGGIRTLKADVGDPIKALTDVAGQLVTTVIPEQALARPEESDAYAGRVFSFATGAGLAAHGVAAAAGLVPTVGAFGLSNLAALLGKVSGWDPVIAAVWDTRIRAALATPASYKWAKVYRPEVPDLRDLEELLVKRVITREEFLDWGGYSGLPQRWLEARAGVAFRELSLRDIVQVQQLFPLDVAAIAEILRKHGFGDREIELLAPTLALGGVRDELRSYRSLADRLFRLGAMDRAEYEHALDATRVAKEFVPVIAELQERLLDVEDREETAKFLLELYEAGELDRVQAMQRLLDLGIRAARVEARLDRVDLRTRIKERKATAAAEAKALAAAARAAASGGAGNGR